MGGLVYYSSETENTHRFVAKLGLPATRIPISPKDGTPKVDGPYVLFVPTYADGDGRGAVPKGIIRFLNDEENRKGIRGVIGGGNLNFGTMYCQGAKAVAEKCGVPLLYRFELLGTPEDVTKVKSGLDRFWRETQ
ncbi:class Ib ribonucleoside-diphosphate reductase assembly flavoprotein NrdI [Agrobacterium salinitolerans]|nr:class Ib ribonucleoside-diphosphate reductase assembly flavoprotein NrdI [Agrobacterium salinitolerans]